MSAVSVADRFRGCLLGLAVGDALGAPYEGLPADLMYHGFGRAEDIVRDPPEKTLYYTDDTEMTLGVAEVLAEHGEIKEEPLITAFARNYRPERGYGPGGRKILDAVVLGEDWRAVAATVFPGGSLGNGAAMRVAPVGMLFRDDLGRVAEQARLSALPTHHHPVGIDGARVMAVAVALASRGGPFDRRAFYRELLAVAQTEEFHWALRSAARLRPSDSVSILGNSLQAHRSVVTSIACFAFSPDSYAGAVERAIGLGNDIDTLAAMAGALSGARLGIAGVPANLLAKLEGGRRGRGYIEGLADRLGERYAGGML